MGQTIAEYYMEEGHARGLIEGRAKGVAEGQAKEARRLLLHLGRQRFGEPSQQIVAAVSEVNDVDRLERLTDRLLQVNSWQELLDIP